MNIADILNAPIHGNAHNDMSLFDSIDAFIMADNDMADKVKCIRKLDETMGEMADSYGESDVVEYIAGR